MTNNKLIETDEFTEWLEKLNDHIGKTGIVARLARAKGGNFGDHKLLPQTGGIYEMRIFKGNGYRVYYAQQGGTIYLLLIGGSKDQQQADIATAKDLWRHYQAKDNE